MFWIHRCIKLSSRFGINPLHGTQKHEKPFLVFTMTMAECYWHFWLGIRDAEYHAKRTLRHNKNCHAPAPTLPCWENCKYLFLLFLILEKLANSQYLNEHLLQTQTQIQVLTNEHLNLLHTFSLNTLLIS